jgi:thioredoxin-like negative regulator of GroEL
MIFNWKKGETQQAPFVAQPDKARPFLDRARDVAEKGNATYALQLFANAVRFDPANIAIHDAFFECAKVFFSAGGVPAKPADVKQLESATAVDRFAQAEYAWMRDPNSLDRALDLLDAAAKAGQTEFGGWFSPKAINLVATAMAKKPNKKVWKRAKDLFTDLQAWNEAFIAGEQAIKLDPTDTELINDLKELTAARAIQQGGYGESPAADGGYRKAAREPEPTESISGVGGSDERNLEARKKAYQENPLSADNVLLYAQALRKTGEPEHEKIAYQVFMQAFTALKEYRFKQAAGEIKIARARRQLAAIEAKAAQAPEDAAAQADAAKARRAVLELEIAEYKDRASAYPTDRSVKFEIGRIMTDQGKSEEAMPYLQQAKEEPKLRAAAAHLLGRCFAAEQWYAEAVEEYKAALSWIDPSQSERELEIKYELMLALIELARAERSLQNAKDAAEICSAILRKDIGYRDIRNRRKELDALVRELA